MREKLSPLLEKPAVSPTVYLCAECEELLQAGADSCPECGGELEKASETHQSYWPF